MALERSRGSPPHSLAQPAGDVFRGASPVINRAAAAAAAEPGIGGIGE
jgi:hypothetical protein